MKTNKKTKRLMNNNKEICESFLKPSKYCSVELPNRRHPYSTQTVMASRNGG